MKRVQSVSTCRHVSTKCRQIIRFLTSFYCEKAHSHFVDKMSTKMSTKCRQNYWSFCSSTWENSPIENVDKNVDKMSTKCRQKSKETYVLSPSITRFWVQEWKFRVDIFKNSYNIDLLSDLKIEVEPRYCKFSNIGHKIIGLLVRKSIVVAWQKKSENLVQKNTYF